MEFKEHKQELVTRLACCAVAALILCYGAEQLGGRLSIPQLERLRPWLEENRVQAIAITAAVLFGASLALFPLKDALPEPEGPCGGYEKVEDLP